MKKLAAILCFSALATAAFAQGQIQFVNAAGPVVQYQNALGQTANIPGVAGQYYFALLTAPVGTVDPTAFTFSGVYGTNLAVAGIIRGGSTVPGWAAGTSRAFEIAAWSADGGVNWNAAWLTSAAARAGSGMGYWGLSAMGSGLAGGVDSTGGTVPPLPLFGASGIPTTSAFLLTPVPEPTTIALAGLGAAALLIFRRRK